MTNPEQNLLRWKLRIGKQVTNPEQNLLRWKLRIGDHVTYPQQVIKVKVKYG